MRIQTEILLRKMTEILLRKMKRKMMRKMTRKMVRKMTKRVRVMIILSSHSIVTGNTEDTELWSNIFPTEVVGLRSQSSLLLCHLRHYSFEFTHPFFSRRSHTFTHNLGCVPN